MGGGASKPKNDFRNDTGADKVGNTDSAIAYASSLEKQAEAHCMGKRYDKALPALQEALSTRQAEQGPDAIGTANTLHLLGQLYEKLNRPESAIKMHERSLAVRYKIFGNNTAIVSQLTSLGTLLMRQGRMAEALPHLTQAVKIQEEAYGPVAKQLLPALANQSAAWYWTKRWDLCMESRARAMKIAEDTLEETDVRWITVLAGYAQVMIKQGDFQAALPILLRGLRVAETIHGALSPETVTWMIQLQRAYIHLQEYRKALPFARKSVDVCEGGNSKAARLRLSMALNNLAGINEFLGNYVAAAEIRLRCTKTLEAILSLEHPACIAARSNLLLLLDISSVPGQTRVLGVEESLSWQRIWHEMMEAKHRKRSARQYTIEDRMVLSSAIARVAFTLSEQGRHEEAIPLHSEAVNLLWELEAAVLIQSTVRGHQCRKRTNLIKPGGTGSWGKGIPNKSMPTKLTPHSQTAASVENQPQHQEPGIPMVYDVDTATKIIQRYARGFQGRQKAKMARARAEQRKNYKMKRTATVICSTYVDSVSDNLQSNAEADLAKPCCGKQKEQRELEDQLELLSNETSKIEQARREGSAHGQRYRQLTLLMCRLAASRFCNKQYETAAKCFDRAAAFLVKFKGIDHVDREVLGSQLEKLYRDDVIRLGLSYGQILAHVQQGQNWFPPQRAIVFFSGLDGSSNQPVIETEEIFVPYCVRTFPSDWCEEGALPGEGHRAMSGFPPNDRVHDPNVNLHRRNREELEEEITLLQLYQSVGDKYLEDVVEDMVVDVVREIACPLLSEYEVELLQARERSQGLVFNNVEVSRQERMMRFKAHRVDYQRMRLRLHRMYGTPITKEDEEL
mmetsp:Transcript_19009/g.36282  ORF Transcript_19009/g.36282 Transcript_19009/m.36282 type:complete len:850 (+) Transcript_19009:214-2763(+)